MNAAGDPDSVRFQRAAELPATLVHRNIGAACGVEQAHAITAIALEEGTYFEPGCSRIDA